MRMNWAATCHKTQCTRCLGLLINNEQELMWLRWLISEHLHLFTTTFSNHATAKMPAENVKYRVNKLQYPS